jgi:hypothetical protein
MTEALRSLFFVTLIDRFNRTGRANAVLLREDATDYSFKRLLREERDGYVRASRIQFRTKAQRTAISIKFQHRVLRGSISPFSICTSLHKVASSSPGH